MLWCFSENEEEEQRRVVVVRWGFRRRRRESEGVGLGFKEGLGVKGEEAVEWRN